MVQDAPAASVPRQLSPSLKSPVVATPLTVIEADPSFVTFTGAGALFVPTGWPLNRRLPGLTLSDDVKAAIPLPSGTSSQPSPAAMPVRGRPTLPPGPSIAPPALPCQSF